MIGQSSKEQFKKGLEVRVSASRRQLHFSNVKSIKQFLVNADRKLSIQKLAKDMPIKRFMQK